MKRSPMRRGSGFKPKYPRKEPKQLDACYTIKPKAVACRIEGLADRMSVPVPKPEKSKPGKRTPTKEEREWMDAITALGCIACRLDGHEGVPGAVHHILRGGRRIGHMHTLCLCDPGHHQNGAPDKISRHPWKARFEKQYGLEENLLLTTRELVRNGLV